MTKQQIFTAAHKEAKFYGFTSHRNASYSTRLSIALKVIYANEKITKEFGDVDKYMINALTAIKKGGSFNGTVYTKKAGTNDLELFVYVDSKKIFVGREHKNDAQKQIARFEKAAKKVKKVATVSDSKKGLSYEDAYNRYGFDFAEEGNY